jgi:hypothetical protein
MARPRKRQIAPCGLMPTICVRTLATGGEFDRWANYTRPLSSHASDQSSPNSPVRVMRILTLRGIVGFWAPRASPLRRDAREGSQMGRINFAAQALGRFLVAASGVAFLAWIAGARAEQIDSAPAVDLELILAADVSGSMTKDELRMQREGYVNALRNVDVINATLSGTRGRIAIAYFEWASPDDQRLVMPWTVIDGADSARSFANALKEQPIGTYFYGGLAGGGTSISGALSFSSRLLQGSGLQADRQVIDVSGDGPNNCGSPIAPIRDRLISLGTTINGLAISPSKLAADTTDSLGKPTLEWYYKSCVVGGPGAFVIAVGDRADFEKAIRRKLVLEIAGAPPRIQVAAEMLSPRPDCFPIGQSPGR